MLTDTQKQALAAALRAETNANRKAIADIWGNTDSVAVLQACVRKATHAEAYLDGTSATTNTVTALKLNWTGTVSVSLLDPDWRMFKRRAIKGVGSGHAQEITWLVAELDGVRLYQHGNQIIMTKQDMYP